MNQTARQTDREILTAEAAIERHIADFNARGLTDGQLQRILENETLQFTISGEAAANHKRKAAWMELVIRGVEPCVGI